MTTLMTFCATAALILTSLADNNEGTTRYKVDAAVSAITWHATRVTGEHMGTVGLLNGPPPPRVSMAPPGPTAWARNLLPDFGEPALDEFNAECFKYAIKRAEVLGAVPDELSGLRQQGTRAAALAAAADGLRTHMLPTRSSCLSLELERGVATALPTSRRRDCTVSSWDRMSCRLLPPSMQSRLCTSQCARARPMAAFSSSESPRASNTW